MKRLVVIFLSLILFSVETNGNSIIKKGNTGWYELITDDGDVLFEVSEIYATNIEETELYFYFFDSKGFVCGTKNSVVLVNKETGDIDYHYSNLFPFRLSKDNKYLLGVKYPTKQEKASCIRYNESKKLYYVSETLYTPFSEPVLIKLETGEEININNIDSSFIKKNQDNSSASVIHFDDMMNSFIIDYVSEGGYKSHIVYIDLDTMTFHIKKQTIGAVKGDIMVCNDNLRLREEESTSSKTKVIMSKGTMIRVLTKGKTDVIDNLTSNWAEVEVIKDSKTNEGICIPKGTRGWCFAGYLDELDDLSLLSELNGQ